MRSKIVVPVVVVTLVVAGLSAFFINQTALGSTAKIDGVEKKEVVGDAGQLVSVGESEITEEKTSIGEGPTTEKEMIPYSGDTIAGSTTPYIRYNKADFDRALREGKLIYLYFYATWCPLCKAERPSILSAFDSLGETGAVGFEVHWGDGQNTVEDNDLARYYGVSSQHTHVFIGRDGKVVEKIVGSLNGRLAENIISLSRA